MEAEQDERHDQQVRQIGDDIVKDVLKHAQQEKRSQRDAEKLDSPKSD